MGSKKEILNIFLCFTIFTLMSSQHTKAASCTELTFWYDSPNWPLDDGYQEASMWYTPCYPSEGTTKVFNHDHSNASTMIVSGSRVRIGKKNHAESLLDTTSITGDKAYASCTFDENYYQYIDTCQVAGPPPWSGRTSPSSKLKKEKIK